MKVLIVYDTKHGNTKKVAELISDGLKSDVENDVTVENVENVNLNKEEDYDLIVIGSPNHYGKPTKPIKNFINTLPKASLKGKAFAVFDTYMFKDYEKVVKKMEKKIIQLMPNLTKAISGLSVRVEATKGPIKEEELPRCKDFGLSLKK